MKRSTLLLSALVLAVSAGSAMAATDDLDVRRLNSSLDQLSSDPSLGGYAQAEQARAREAINQMAQFKPKDKVADFTNLWSGQAAPLGRELPAGELTRLLGAEALARLAH